MRANDFLIVINSSSCCTYKVKRMNTIYTTHKSVALLEKDKILRSDR